MRTPTSIVYLVTLFLTVRSNKSVQEQDTLEEVENAESPWSLCSHVDPYKDLHAWRSVSAEKEKCNHTSHIDKQDEKETERRRWGEKAFSFDMVASDKIGSRRTLQYQADKRCQKVKFEATSSVSVVIIYHNECLSVLLRMLVSIVERTPAKLLKEIILYDDASEDEHKINEKVREFVDVEGWGEKVKMIRTEERQGLIRAKVYAARKASGDVLVFLDSHCEVTDNWLPPLLEPIEESEKTVVLPVVDLISPVTFEYSKALVAKSGFDDYLNFKWLYIPYDYWDVEENNVKPFESPSMSGGLLAIKKSYFETIGEYDMGMEIWGAENHEMSMRVWMCGGRVLVAPCSRVGHVFRMRRPYKSKPKVRDAHDTNLFNSARTAKVWMGDYEKYFLRARPRAADLRLGDLSERIDLKGKLKCKDFQWYLDNVYPEFKRDDIHHKEEL